jgi:hypothetical protein
MLRHAILAGIAIGGAFAAILASPETRAQSPVVSGITVEGTELVVALTDGRTLRSADLVGAMLDVRFEGRPVKLRITGVERDPGDKSGTVWLHTFESRQADGTWSNVCRPGPDGRRQGFPLQGQEKGIDFTCSSGAVGKCVRFGYRPWATGPDGRSLAPQHAACVRMVRGDYGGADQPFTKDGMTIDLYDPQGIQTPDMTVEQTFEAGWGPDGAVCVHHVRVKENVTLAELEARFPRLRGRTGAICTEAFARQHGAILLNRSRD